MRWVLYPLTFLLGLVVLGIAVLALAVAFAWPTLPSLEALTDYHPKIPLRVYTADGALIGEYGDERRAFIHIQDVPPVLKNAILAAEDDRFYQHSGVDLLGILRAAGTNIVTGSKRQGSSTITMQVARNFFLTREKTYSRKLYEILLAFKIEQNLTKDQILEVYINQIFLGRRAYGFAVAAHTYFGKSIRDLNIPEAAMLAGLPKAPSAYNPIVNPKRAALRQQYVLRRMTELGFISDAEQQQALATPLKYASSSAEFGGSADYVAEMARQIAVEQFKDEAYTRGIKVITTIDRGEQEAAYRALRRGVMDYDRRHGYRGAEAYVDPTRLGGEQQGENLDEVLADTPDYDDLKAAVVTQAAPGAVTVYRYGETIRIAGEGLRFAAAMLGDKAPPNKRIRPGAIVRIAQTDNKAWEITQLPEVEGALTAADPRTGAIRALVGGFDFNRNKFNHVTQAWRQPGSSFKPFIYSASFEKGYGPNSIVDDSPLSFPAGETGSQAWEPKNYDGKYDGPISLRTALARSKNMVSIRLLKSIGPRYAQDYVTKFGFDAERHPPYLTMALGAGSVTPWQMLRAYAVFANGGYRVEPYLVKEIRDESGAILARVDPPVAGETAERAIDARNAYLMDSMMKDVVRRGTATRALTLKRGDLAGKTGTTNDYIDAWFCGYQPTVVAVSWIGFDQPRKLGSGETGGAAALPMWIGYMRRALEGVPESYPPAPDGLIRVQPGGGGTEELIYKENLPAVPTEAPVEAPHEGPADEAPPR
ncbi:MAG TPA: penicillin-binding protein 1A [Zoogloea sp.]|uniref:penicillin-binding protein 1A n=1 Tax=Zoogloea sp. TaxID=49181 RepID=UPI002CE9F444|nr:penicillin-binding protein 1A [Zoogloea sp.]HMV16570.1 penicillin-binding protein 1A [Rhodocyclaceae bacterium]HMV62021.1 penicillin-binding protein 1A [Rhodocyclaceae bacterium]HMW51194.1 penicillin-binding protein 1A [Rhodocyclaceae bacterium]HMY48720.1 penicillin-binding protein 1A [Rhodocyclaceae bacterium]HMZ76825.1 penicillin-binding protein 1A [Rhodocyclaceae bacterium]